MDENSIDLHVGWQQLEAATDAARAEQGRCLYSGDAAGFAAAEGRLAELNRKRQELGNVAAAINRAADIALVAEARERMLRRENEHQIALWGRRIRDLSASLHRMENDSLKLTDHAQGVMLVGLTRDLAEAKEQYRKVTGRDYGGAA